MLRSGSGAAAVGVDAWPVEDTLLISVHAQIPSTARDRRPGCRSGSRLRWWRASPCRSNRRRARDCAMRCAAPGRLAFCAGVAAKVARRSRTICHGGSALGRPATVATSSPERPRQRLARHVEQAVGGADRDREAARKREQPFGGAVHDADDGREAGGRIDAEMRVDDGAELGRHRRARARDRAATTGGTARMTASPVVERDLVSSPKSSAATLLAGEIAGAQPVAELHRAPCARRESAAPDRRRRGRAHRARSAAGRPCRRPPASRA